MTTAPKSKHQKYALMKIISAPWSGITLMGGVIVIATEDVWIAVSRHWHHRPETKAGKLADVLGQHAPIHH